jgi:hypothetical protein
MGVHRQTAVKKYVVKLSDAEREQLNTRIRSGKHRARQLIRARILLKADASTDTEDRHRARLRDGIRAAPP